MVGTANRGGQANEGGSLHRAGVAAFLAVHGLFGRGVAQAGFPSNGPYPTEISLETADSVDDIKCLMSDGSTWFIQAKRACGADAHLKSTVAQWCAQTLGSDDRLGLAVRAPSGAVRELGAALDKRRRGSRLLASEESAITAVTDRIPSNHGEAFENDLLSAAHVLVVQVEQDRDTHAVAAANWLAGRLVPDSDGARAFEALRSHFQRAAAEAGSSDLNDWIGALGQAGLTLFSDANGPVAARRQALRTAVIAYRERLASRADVLSYSLFSELITPEKFPELLETFVVNYCGPSDDRGRDRPLRDVARRSPRFILRGLPGSGKSVALEQLAARWAGDEEAPLPILVPLRRISNSIEVPSDVTLRLLAEASVSGVDVENPSDAVDGIVMAAKEGHAVLLLDGLDETFERRAVVVDGLMRLAAELTTDCGLIIATREAGLAAAERTNLPVATLSTPSSLEESLTTLLSHTPASRVGPLRDPGWLESRTVWLRDCLDSAHELWRIPLTATLMTVAAIEGPVTSVPSSRAALLCRGLNESVRRWEHRRLAEATEWDRELRAEMLLGAFAVVGNMLSGNGTAELSQARGLIADHLKAEWGLAPALADIVAEQTLRFWNEQLGILLIVGDRLEPRHRQLAEVGQAMWVQVQDRPAQIAWLQSALKTPNMSESIALVFELSAEVRAALFEVACDVEKPGQARALELYVNFVNAGHTPSSVEYIRLMVALERAARSKLPRATSERQLSSLRELIAKGEDGQDKFDGPGWFWARNLATIHLPQEERAKRAQYVRNLDLNEEKAALAAALALLTDLHDGSATELKPEEAAAIEAVITRPLPPRQPTVERLSRKAPIEIRTSPPILTGYGEAAVLAASYAGHLASGSAECLYEIAGRASHRQALEIRKRLRSFGFKDPEPGSFDSTFSFGDFQATYWGSWRSVLSATHRAASPGKPSSDAAWRMTHLCKLLDAVGFGHFYAHDARGIIDDDPDLLIGWLTAAARSYGIDLSRASWEAGLALEDFPQVGEPGERIEALEAAPFSETVDEGSDKLSGEDISALVNALKSASESVRVSAANLLIGSEAINVSEMVSDIMDLLHPRAKLLAAWVMCACSGDSASMVTSLMASADPMRRIGAARFLRRLAPGIAEMEMLLAAAQVDPDMSVRVAVKVDQAQAERASFWTCLDCGGRNDIDQLDCPSCSSGARPGKHPSSRSVERP